MRQYSLYGLAVASDLPLDGASEGGDAPTDVTISVSALPPDFPRDDGAHAMPGGGFLLNIAQVARYWVKDRREIVVEPVPGVHESDVRLFLLGSTMGALLYRRGWLPLHANAIVIGGKAVALTGPSGSGKSTLAMAFSRRGFPLLSDDVCAIDNEGRVRPGLRRVRLWDEAMRASGIDPAVHPRSFPGDPDYAKHDVAVMAEPATAATLGAVLLFSPEASEEFERLGPSQGAGALVANLYRGEYAGRLGVVGDVVRRCADLAAKVPVYRFSRLEGLGRLDEDVDRIAALFEGR